jgi:DNA-directed RNA polymerase specialized sigma24 family protein
MKKRHIPGIEVLEARETPDVSLGSAATRALPLSPTPPVVFGQDLPLAVPALADANSNSYLQALETVFADAEGLKKLLTEATSSEPQGWQFLCNYTRKALRNEELKYGSLPDHEDVLHEVFVEWREQVGSTDAALTHLLDRESPERQLLRKTVRRVLDHARYERTRQKRMVELFDQPAPVKPSEQDWIDVQLDWASGAGALGARERQLLELRGQGKTFEEIGAEMGLLKQRVCELFNASMDRLQALYDQA